MAYQVQCHNDVTMIGRLCRPAYKTQINNQKALKLCLAVPNDENYELNPNYINAYLYTNDLNMFRGKVGIPLAFNGHIESKHGIRIIIDVLSIIKEAK